LTDFAKKPDTQSRPKYELPSASGEELDTIGELTGVGRWDNLRFVPLTTHDSVNLSMPVEQARKLLNTFHESFPRWEKLLKVEPLPAAYGGHDFEVERDPRGFYHFKKLPRPKYVIIFRKKS
jgi:hypothetical protein